MLHENGGGYSLRAVGLLGEAELPSQRETRLTSNRKIWFGGYPRGFRALVAFDFAYFVVVLGYVVYLSALGLPTSSQVGLALGLSMNAVVIIAFACILWRYRLKSKDNQRTSVYVLFVL